MAWAMSSGWPTRPRGMCAASAAASPRLPSAGVATRPGSTPLTVMPSPASSSAAARMKPLTRPCSPHSARAQGSPCADRSPRRSPGRARPRCGAGREGRPGSAGSSFSGSPPGSVPGCLRPVPRGRTGERQRRCAGGCPTGRSAPGSRSPLVSRRRARSGRRPAVRPCLRPGGSPPGRPGRGWRYASPAEPWRLRRRSIRRWPGRCPGRRR